MKRRIRTTGRSDGLEQERIIRDAAYAAGFAEAKKIATKEKAALRKRMKRQKEAHEMQQIGLSLEVERLKKQLKEAKKSRVVKVEIPYKINPPLPWSNKPEYVSWSKDSSDDPHSPL